MFTSDKHDPEEALACLADPLRFLHAALDDGVSLADTIVHGNEYDAHAHSTLVRWRARNVLRDEASDTWSLGRELPNCGIEIVCAEYVARALKAQDNGPPHPGSSAARKRFWSQGFQQLRLALARGDSSDVVGANVIIDWTIGPQREILLALSKPVGLWKYKGAPRLEWRKPVVFDAAHEPRFLSTEEDGVEVEPVFDLSELNTEDGTE